MRDITLEELLEAGCHFGHQVNRRNPRADEFIFETRANVNIIDLSKTREGLIKAGEFVKKLSSQGGYIVVVGTKRQAKQIVENEFKKAQEADAQGLFYVTMRWIGGTLTNFSEVKKNFKRLNELRALLKDTRSDYTKHELLLFEREKNKLESLYDGISQMERIPDALFVIDTHLERTAVKEAHSQGLKIVGIVDTNADPLEVDYAIPANDDAAGSLQLIISYMVDAWVEGAKQAKGEGEAVKEEAKPKREKKVEKTGEEKPAEVKEEAPKKKAPRKTKKVEEAVTA